jgi:hypothetical protein
MTERGSGTAIPPDQSRRRCAGRMRALGRALCFTRRGRGCALSATLAGPWSTLGLGGEISPPDHKRCWGRGWRGALRRCEQLDPEGRALGALGSLGGLPVPSVYSPSTRCAPCETHGMHAAEESLNCRCRSLDSLRSLGMTASFRTHALTHHGTRYRSTCVRSRFAGPVYGTRIAASTSSISRGAREIHSTPLSVAR